MSDSVVNQYAAAPEHQIDGQATNEMSIVVQSTQPSRSPMKGIVRPSLAEWEKIFEDCAKYPIADVSRYNPELGYTTIYTRLNLWKAGEKDRATRKLTKKRRKQHISEDDQEDDEIEEIDIEAVQFGTSKNRLRIMSPSEKRKKDEAPAKDQSASSNQTKEKNQLVVYNQTKEKNQLVAVSGSASKSKRKSHRSRAHSSQLSLSLESSNHVVDMVDDDVHLPASAPSQNLHHPLLLTNCASPRRSHSPSRAKRARSSQLPPSLEPSTTDMVVHLPASTQSQNLHRPLLLTNESQQSRSPSYHLNMPELDDEHLDLQKPLRASIDQWAERQIAKIKAKAAKYHRSIEQPVCL